jgi:hypothetical protein
VNEDVAYVVDYKTGSDRYPDLEQLKLMALMTFVHFPKVNKVKGALLFILKNNLVSEDYERSQIPALWDSFTPKVKRLELSYEKNEWPTNPTPLCTLYNLLVLTVPFGGMVVSSWSLRRVKKNEKRLDILGINPHY